MKKPYKPIAQSKRRPKVKCGVCGHVHTCCLEFGPCDCGRDMVAYDGRQLYAVEVDNDGWKHTQHRCFPPPKSGARCKCGYAWLRDPKRSWSVATYSSRDDPRRKLIHTVERCFDDPD
jgi:hypothetical protein